MKNSKERCKYEKQQHNSNSASLNLFFIRSLPGEGPVVGQWKAISKEMALHQAGTWESKSVFVIAMDWNRTLRWKMYCLKSRWILQLKNKSCSRNPTLKDLLFLCLQICSLSGIALLWDLDILIVWPCWQYMAILFIRKLQKHQDCVNYTQLIKSSTKNFILTKF